jgi:hypothetical protein
MELPCLHLGHRVVCIRWSCPEKSLARKINRGVRIIIVCGNTYELVAKCVFEDFAMGLSGKR